MSGRVRVTLADGRRVTGFRKTLAQRAARTPLHLMPDWQISFCLPAYLALAGHTHGIVGVQVSDIGHVTITGKRRTWVERQLYLFLKSIAPMGLIDDLQVRISRAAEPGPTASGPTRAGASQLRTISFNGRDLGGLAA